MRRDKLRPDKLNRRFNAFPSNFTLYVAYVFYAVCILMVSTTAILLLTGCAQKNQQQGQQQSAEGQQQEEKAPDNLKKLEESIESIISALDGPTAGNDKKEGGQQNDQNKETEGKQGGEQGQQEQKGQGQQGQGDSQGNKDQGTEKQGQVQSKEQGQSQQEQDQQGQKEDQQSKGQDGQQQAAQKDPWKEISTSINNLHYQWNDYAPEAVKKGLSRELTDKFGSNLNTLTNEIARKDKNKTLAAANMLYSGIPDFYSLYRTKTSPEIKRMRYYARSAVLSAGAGDWQKAASDAGNLKASWTLFKNTLEKDQQELSGKLDLSIYELDKVVGAKDLRLTDIKGRVVLSNIQEIEKSMEKGK